MIRSAIIIDENQESYKANEGYIELYTPELRDLSDSVSLGPLLDLNSHWPPRLLCRIPYPASIWHWYLALGYVISYCFAPRTSSLFWDTEAGRH